jgi:glycine/D-amino acid oxidase-like deaminating enzyme/nitrite reductase/ring-hydroxylating ferredoxin subunit
MPSLRVGPSPWITTSRSEDVPPLEGDRKVDVAVLGAGIAGITTAWILAEAGVRVALIEARRIAQGVSGYTTAKLTSLHGLIYAELVRRHGRERARLYGEANQAAIERVAAIVEERAIDCDLRRADAFTWAEDVEEAAAVEEEARTAADLGLPADVTKDTGLPFPVERAVRFRGQAHFHPRKYLLALARAVVEMGGVVAEGTTAQEVEEGSPCRVRTDRGTVTAEHVVLATHMPFPFRGMWFARMWLKRSFAMALALRGPVPQGMYIRASSDFHSMRPLVFPGRELLILGGGRHQTGQAEDTDALVSEVEAWGRERFPVEAVEHRWATQDLVTPDRVPWVGPITRRAERVFVATGFGGWGMTNGTAAGMILSDRILGRANPWSDLYDPSRGAARASLGGLARDALTTVRDLSGGFDKEPAPDAASPVAPGEGRVVTRGIEKVAVSRDDDGTLHEVSAVCTHLQCLVRWNGAERSWDCPCHGSRFAPDGRVLHGPALVGLPAAPRPAPER